MKVTFSERLTLRSGDCLAADLIRLRVSFIKLKREVIKPLKSLYLRVFLYTEYDCDLDVFYSKEKNK
jgi:hypothetical protein